MNEHPQAESTDQGVPPASGGADSTPRLYVFDETATVLRGDYGPLNDAMRRFTDQQGSAGPPVGDGGDGDGDGDGGDGDGGGGDGDGGGGDGGDGDGGGAEQA